MLYIGCGAFASVYRKRGSDRVVKIGTPNEDHYLKYVKLVGLNNPCIHFPKISKVVVARDFYEVEMEYLTGWSQTSYTMRSKAMTSAGLEYYTDLVEPERIKNTGPHSLQLRKVMTKLFYGDCEDYIDLHEGNVMFRRHGRTADLVVTDPVS
jgi:hypothetical protein